MRDCEGSGKERRRKGGRFDFNVGRMKELKASANLVSSRFDYFATQSNGTVLREPISLDRHLGQSPFTFNCTALRSFYITVRPIVLTWESSKWLQPCRAYEPPSRKREPFFPVPVANGRADVLAFKLISHSVGGDMLEEKKRRS